MRFMIPVASSRLRLGAMALQGILFAATIDGCACSSNADWIPIPYRIDAAIEVRASGHAYLFRPKYARPFRVDLSADEPRGTTTLVSSKEWNEASGEARSCARLAGLQFAVREGWLSIGEEPVMKVTGWLRGRISTSPDKALIAFQTTTGRSPLIDFNLLLRESTSRLKGPRWNHVVTATGRPLVEAAEVDVDLWPCFLPPSRPEDPENVYVGWFDKKRPRARFVRLPHAE